MVLLLKHFYCLMLAFCCCAIAGIVGCSKTPSPITPPSTIPDTVVYSHYSHLPNTYIGFHSPHAINALAKMENAYFRNYEGDGAGYYGTVWRSYAEQAGTPSLYTRFATAGSDARPDSMHCTIYAVRALKAGLGTHWDTLEAAHRDVYHAHEHAGWSIAHLLVRDFGWKAWLFIRPDSPEFQACSKAWKAHKAYPVWRQPDISLEGMLILGVEDSAAQALLQTHEFGWGFSHQGIHTWITHFDTLKECNWLGAPARRWEHPDLIQQDQLFAQTPFLNFRRYASHVVVFPPKPE